MYCDDYCQLDDFACFFMLICLSNLKTITSLTGQQRDVLTVRSHARLKNFEAETFILREFNCRDQIITHDILKSKTDMYRGYLLICTMIENRIHINYLV